MALIALSFPVAVHFQNHALDDCAARPTPHRSGVVTVNWKSLLPPRYACAYGDKEER